MESFAKKTIKETIVVEGRDDVSAVLAAVDANVLITNGYGFNNEIIEKIRGAYEGPGIIIFTDPDHAGLKIRERLSSFFPGAKHAYLTQGDAYRNGDIGIENASPENILKALENAHANIMDSMDSDINEEVLAKLGLVGNPQSKAKRERVGARLGIGYANAKTFLKRLRFMGITKELLEKECE